MLLSTLFSALPLLNPALPAQEPVQSTKQTCTCKKSGEKAVFAKVSVNRNKVTTTPAQDENKNIKQKAQRSLRRTLDNQTRGGNTRGVWKLAKITPNKPGQVITWGEHEDDSAVAGLGTLGRNTGDRAVWGHHDASPVSGLAQVSQGNVIQWGQHDDAADVANLGSVKTKKSTKSGQNNIKKKAQAKVNKIGKNSGQKKVRKNRKR